MAQFELSEYQKKIIHDGLYGVGNMLIQARAGASKTTTILNLIKEIPQEKNILYCAFNTEITLDTQKKIGDKENVKISTIHSLGYEIIRKNLRFEKKISINQYKYKDYVNAHIHEYSTECYENLNYNQKYKFRTNVLNIINLSRINLIFGKKQMAKMCSEHKIMLICDEIECAYEILKWGENNLDVIDFNDMIWLPNIKPFKYPSFDYIFLDEAQDISVAQRELVLKCNNIKTRYIIALDENQLIYGFAGSDVNSLDALKKIKNITNYELPIVYRCPKKVIEFARQFIPNLMVCDTNIDGEVNFNGKISDIKNGDMILCRTNAPLIKLQMYLLEKGIECYIKGADYIDKLIDLLNTTGKQDLSLDLKKDGVFPQLYADLFSLMDYIKLIDCCDDSQVLNNMMFKNRYDEIQVLETLSKDCTSIDELIEKIKTSFTDDNKKGVILSSIHKSKGLENDNVKILCYDIIDEQMKRMSNNNEIQQEINLKYVAITRAKKTLTFITDEEYSKYSNNITLEEIAKLKYQIYNILNIKKNDIKINKEYANEIVKHYEKIEIPSKNNNIVVLQHDTYDESKFRSLKTCLKPKNIKY